MKALFALLVLSLVVIASGCVSGPAPYEPSGAQQPAGASNETGPSQQAQTPDELKASLWADRPRIDITALELEIHSLVNQEREKEGLEPLEWNGEVADSARRHSQDMADENIRITDTFSKCQIPPLIHDEGFVFGKWPADRLEHSGVNYYNNSGENLAGYPLFEIIRYMTYYEPPCDIELPDNYSEMDSFEQVTAGLAAMEATVLEAGKYSVTDITEIVWKDREGIAGDIVSDWMDPGVQRENILDGFYNEAGVGVAEVNDMIIVTQVFITRTDCGYLQAPCCEQDGEEFCYQTSEGITAVYCYMGRCVLAQF